MALSRRPYADRLSSGRAVLLSLACPLGRSDADQVRANLNGLEPATGWRTAPIRHGHFSPRAAWVGGERGRWEAQVVPSVIDHDAEPRLHNEVPLRACEVQPYDHVHGISRVSRRRIARPRPAKDGTVSGLDIFALAIERAREILHVEPLYNARLGRTRYPWLLRNQFDIAISRWSSTIGQALPSAGRFLMMICRPASGTSRTSPPPRLGPLLRVDWRPTETTGFQHRRRRPRIEERVLLVICVSELVASASPCHRFTPYSARPAVLASH
jgi:hypothetical protein